MEVSLKDLKELFVVGEQNDFSKSFIGKNVFIRTVTMAYTGKLVASDSRELLLQDACWIPDTGRFADFLKSGKLNECEPFPAGDVLVGRGAIVDLCLWAHPLPREQK